MDISDVPRTSCPTHGEAEEEVDGQCKRCLRGEVLAGFAELARGEQAIRLDPGERPLSYVPRLDLWPRDFTWLTGGVVEASRLAEFRRLFAISYLFAAEERIRSERPVQALMLLGGAMNFGCPDVAVLAGIHLQTGRTFLAILESRGELDLERMSVGAVRSLASAACHFEIALRHLGAGGMPAVGSLDPAAMRSEAQRLQREILARGYFEIHDDIVIAPPPLGTVPVQRLLFPSVPPGPER